MVNRIGRWVEFDNAYKTMDPTYMESVWWALKTIWDKGLIYEGRKVLMYCPRCETPVSKAEVAMDNSYKDITEETVTVKFKVKNPKKHGLPENTYILAWTTTPWTLPGNVALAVGKDIEYIVIEVENLSQLVVAKDRADAVLGEGKYKISSSIKGSDLVGIEYEPLFEIPAVKNSGKKSWYVTSADFVTTAEGTGVVHTAVIYGEDDYNLGVKIDLPMVPLLNEKGVFNDDAPELIRGQYFKKAEKVIKEDLENRGLLFAKQNHTHSYPHCWRCDTQLFYNAISAWFIDIQKVKKRLIKLNDKINWFPEHLKEGRFLNILETAPDWNISRNRYWATPLPFWKCECGHKMCVGSVKELKEKAVNFAEVYATDKVEEMDLHKDKMDKIKLKCEKCGKTVERTTEVIDCWVESGSMPFAEFHYPFENKKVFKDRFPGQYIAEYIAQTRAWFYYMHAMSTLLFDEVSFENVVCTGTILNEKGEKLSKSKMNYTDPWKIIEQYGVDALRYYMMSSVVMQADDLSFNDREVKDVYNKLINTLWNVVAFYEMYGAHGVILKEQKATEGSLKDKKGFFASLRMTVLDKWILAKLQILVKEVTEGMEKYDMSKASRPIVEFVTELSQWYVRRSRDRFKGENSGDAEVATAVLREVLLTLSKVMAPFTPFMAEKIYLGITGGKEKESVHLEEWPEVNKKLMNEEVLKEMDIVRKIVEMGLALRAENIIKVRQPLAKLGINDKNLGEELLGVIADELNVKKVVVEEFGGAAKEDGELKVVLDLNLTEELKKEGLVREVVRAINQMRKEQKLTINDLVKIEYATDDALLKSVFKDFGEEIKKSVLAKELMPGSGGTETEVDGKKVKINIVK